MSDRKTSVIVLVWVGVLVLLVVLGALGLWLWFDHDMRHPQESGWMDEAAGRPAASAEPDRAFRTGGALLHRNA
ncbi:hypothetical protein SAMN02982929_03385 [Saccharopolyspora kobensis]|uniref:Uncharacterized protein n=1 Tax=Saccharopolyspora kobensis TaxID=146035 RepID=A0A1H6CGZ3_9PSEU|nr:hypothetical protein [Saccharopolyspora kobensis]SEG71636.1 hypothetical protein SAMN02982929_03385 [Saccharopolyspora kobensis]SFC38509.1 hypothetical protein SAMN05216506_101627 [Saccharopolyspora kobensis]